MSKITTKSFIDMKNKGEKITMLTAYDYSTAKLVDQAGVESILVGDSLGMTMLGYSDTLKVTLDDMIHHTKAVVRGTKNALVIGDMPFMSYHISVEESIRNAGRLIQEGGAQAVKLEGGSNVIDHIKGIINAQIPVCGHLGLTPQSVNMMGGFKVQGKSEAAAKTLIDDALKLQEAGVFAIVLEGIPEKLAQMITEKLDIPTIGIGAGVHCDGQVLVIQDMLGMFSDFTPKFVKKYAQLNLIVDESLKTYVKEVKSATFPEEKHTFSMNEDVLNKLY